MAESSAAFHDCDRFGNFIIYHRFALSALDVPRFSFLGDKQEGVVFLKPSTDRMLTRIKSVYLYIKQKGSVSTKELVEEFGTTDRTIQRDLNVLEYNGLVMPMERGIWTTTNKKTKVS